MAETSSGGGLSAQNDVAGARADAQAALRALLKMFAGQVSLRTALAGNGSGTVLVPGDEANAYVRLGDSSGPVAEAKITSFIPANDDPVLLMRESPLGLGGWLILVRLTASLESDKVGSGYAGSFSGDYAQNIGVPDNGAWTHYFVTVTGSPTWTMTLNGSTIASGTGSATGTFSPPVSFDNNSRFVFAFSGSGSDLWFGAA